MPWHREWLKEEREALVEAGVGEREALAQIVAVDKEAECLMEGVKRPAEAAAAPGQAVQIGAQIGVHTLNGVRLLFAPRTTCTPPSGQTSSA